MSSESRIATYLPFICFVASILAVPKDVCVLLLKYLILGSVNLKIIEDVLSVDELSQIIISIFYMFDL